MGLSTLRNLFFVPVWADNVSQCHPGDDCNSERDLKNTATLFAPTVYEISILRSEPGLMTTRKSKAKGAKSTICDIELMATRIAQYSLSPPARPVQTRTIAMHLATPTSMRP